MNTSKRIDELVKKLRVGAGIGSWEAQAKSLIMDLILEARIEELDRLFTTKRVNDEQIVNQATFEYILDRISTLTKAKEKLTNKTT